jgi:hypothetical protein
MIRMRLSSVCRRGWILIVPVMALFLSLGTALPAGASQYIPPGSPTWGKIYGLATIPANCVDLSQDFGFESAEMNYCMNTNSQQWSYIASSYMIVAGAASNYCLTALPGGPGQPVVILPCYSAYTWQTWWIIGQALYNPQSGLCLDDTAYGGAGTRLQTWTCNWGQLNQDWYIVGYGSAAEHGQYETVYW